jgi:hypothetical protein
VSTATQASVCSVTRARRHLLRIIELIHESLHEKFCALTN